MGHYVLELEAQITGFGIVTQLHHYYQATCSCGHRSQAKPGKGKISVVEGRSKDLQLTEYVLVGAVLATFIASLGVRYRMSRTKIKEFLLILDTYRTKYWDNRSMYSRSGNCLCASGRRISRTTATGRYPSCR